MGYVTAGYAEHGTPVNLMVRGKALCAPIGRAAARSFPHSLLSRKSLTPARDTHGHRALHQGSRVDPRRRRHRHRRHHRPRAEQLGDIVFVELPEVGRKAAQGEAVAVVESVKAASDVYSPVAGEVVEVNGDSSTSRRWSTTTPRARPGSSRSGSPTRPSSTR